MKFTNLVSFFSENEKAPQKLWLLGTFSPFIKIRIIRIVHLDLGTSSITTCNCTFVKMLQPTYGSHQLMLINAGDPGQWMYFEEFEKKTGIHEVLEGTLIQWMKLEDEHQLGWKKGAIVIRNLDPKHRGKVTAWKTGVEGGMIIWDIINFPSSFAKDSGRSDRMFEIINHKVDILTNVGFVN